MTSIPPIDTMLDFQPIGKQLNIETGDSVDSFMGNTRLGLLDGGQSIQNQGLSLSFGSHLPDSIPIPSFSYQRQLCEVSGFGKTILNSKYLMAVQQLLDEVINVREATKELRSNKHVRLNDSYGSSLPSSKESDLGSNGQHPEMCSNPSDSTTNSSVELSPRERQDLKNKNTKLVSMLNEVDQRYKRYYYQMQIVASSFNMVAGHGAAESYISRAHKTISCYFRSLRDAISDQIQVTRRSLGEQEGIPCLRYVDQQIRQQSALLHLGMTQHSWRPQRGLPGNSVSILRAWLFEHFLHPYPTDSEKIMLARETGLTKSQVANWFINARVRLWKPMVEEMYQKEFGYSQMELKISPENASKSQRENSLTSEDKGECKGLQDSNSYYVSRAEMNGQATKTGSFQGYGHADNVTGAVIMKFRGDCTLSLYDIIQQSQTCDQIVMAANNSYDISKAGTFTNMRHCETDDSSTSEGIYTASNNAAASLGLDSPNYPCLEPQKDQLRFGINSSLVHDFVI